VVNNLLRAYILNTRCNSILPPDEAQFQAEKVRTAQAVEADKVRIAQAVEANKRIAQKATAHAEAAKNFEQVTVTPENIVTVDQTDRMTACKATLVSHGDTALLSLNLATGEANTNAAIQLPIQYTVERTDDGQLLVTVYGLSRGLLQF